MLSLSFSANGELLASSGGTGDETIILWELAKINKMNDD